MEGGRPVPTQTITEGDAGDGERAGLALVIQETEAQSRLAVLARLAPYRLVRHVIASREPIDHESYFDQTCCAALFIDISGFSKMTEKLVNKNGLEGAEQLARHLNINLGRIVDRLTQCGADVIKFAGDAALCIFPVVEGGPDLAAQTLRATQLSLECISALERENYIVEGIRLTAHSGLGCGEATGFFAGGAQPAHLANARTEYTPIGAPMTQIASSEPAAGDGETVVSPQCWALIGDQCEGRVVVDEKSHETNYLVTSIKPEFKINLDEGATGGITEELRALTEAEADMVADQIKVVVPEAVHAHLTDLQPGAIPTIAEFRSVTVLFSRLTGLDYSRGRSELQKVQRIVRLIQETIYKHAGQLMRFSVDDKGAVVLGVFGLPPSNQDDPERGVLAAMEYCKAITAGDFDGVRATVGITTGYCFSGLVGGVSRCEYTTHGPLVNLAARLMVASERDALVDTDTRDRCLSSGSLIEFDTMPPIKVKGREELVPIFVPRKVAKVKARVIARSASVAHMGERTSSGTSFGSSPKSPGRNTPKTPRGQRQRQQSREVVNRVVPSQKMIGRRQECELIRKVFMQVVLDADAAVSPTLPPLCVLAEGEAGIGKSELCREAMHYARGLEMDCFWTAGHADTISSPLRPFRCILRGLFNEEQKHAKLSAGASSGAEGGELVSEKFQKDRTITQLTNVFSSLDCPEDLRRHAGMFYTFVTAHPSEDAGSDLHAPTMVKLIVHWLAERCARHPPTLLVLDDAQWLDPTSWALCEILAASEKCRGRLLMVFASRPIPKHSMLARRTQFLRRSSSNHMELQPMTKPELIEIITKRLESESIESSSGGVFTPDSPARRRKTAGAGGSLDADEEEVPKLDSNEAIKQYMAQFSESCVHVGGLGNGQEEDEEVEELFGQFGTVYGASVRIREGANRSWGLVSFASQAQAEVVINSRIGLLDKIERGRMSHAQAMRSTGSLHLVYKQQMEKVQLRLQRTLLQTEAEKLTAGRQSAVLSKQDVQHLLGVVGVELSSLQLNSAMRQLDDSGDGIVAEISAFHDWWAANGSDLTATASASYRLPPEVEEVIKRHPSGSPLRMLLLAKEMVAGDQVAEEGVPQSPGSPRRPRRHTASDGSVLQTDEDTAAAISRMLRRLTPDEQHVLQLVAVCGADSSLRMIQTMQHEVDAMQSVSSKHVIDDRNIVPTFTQLAAKKILNYPGSLAVMFDTDGHVPHLLFAEKIVEEVVLASLKGTERHIFTLAGLQRYLFTPELHREQLARGYARTENGGDDAGRHLCSAALLAIEMQADCEAAQLCSEIVELPAMQGEDSETNRIRWLKRLAAARLRCGRDGRELAAALAPTVEALRLCEMTLPADKEGAAANTSLLLRGGQVAIPSPKPSKKPVVASAGKMRFKRLARKATQKNAGMSHVADAATAKKKSDMSAFHETTAEPRWMSLTELHLLLASSAQAAGMWALQNYATVAALRLLEARGQMQSGRVAAGGVGALALTNVGFGSSTAGAGGYSSLSGGERYQTEAEAALAARVHSAVAANARQLGVPEWAHEQRELAQGALDALASKTEAAVRSFLRFA
jgi:class 3 adenylate cyclase